MSFILALRTVVLLVSQISGEPIIDDGQNGNIDGVYYRWYEQNVVIWTELLRQPFLDPELRNGHIASSYYNN